MKNSIIIISLLVLFSCKAGKDFKAPSVEMPLRYVGVYNQQRENLVWWQLFNDTTLYRLVSSALANNLDLAVAASRVEQARLSMKETRSSLYPSFGYSLSAEYGTQTPVGKMGDKPRQGYDVGLNIGWEIDLWGKIRRSTEAARAQMFASEAAQRGVYVSLIAEVATTYFSLLNYENALAISERTLISREESLQLIEISYKRGASSALVFEQAKGLVAQAKSAIPKYTAAIIQSNYALSVLMGQNPTYVMLAHKPLSQQRVPSAIPVGLPSDLLDRRPDIIQAYYTVASGNAMVGVAQAMRLPTISLTGQGGLASNALSELFMAKSFVWTSSASIAGAIFEFGKNKRRVDVAREELYQNVLSYRQTVLQALQETNDALVDINSIKEQIAQEHALLESSRRAQRLTFSRYTVGYSPYLDLLDADRTLFEVELEYSQLLVSQLNAYVSLYKALGGGW